MPVVTPKNETVKSLSGLHLYHSGISNCSMRVRLALEEKRLPWESHHLDIIKKEHLTPEYFGVHPKGLVPSLVHNGVVIIESDDIIDYIDREFPEHPLRPTGEGELNLMYEWLHRATRIHVKAVKTHIYEKRIAGKMAQDAAEEERYKELQGDAELLEFHHKSSTGSFSQQELAKAKATLDECFDDLEQALSDAPWVAGESYSLADIAWIPLHFTLEALAGYSFSDRPNVRQWAQRVQERPSFKQGVLEWWPG
ncbi:MAG: glutathione S-transferase family protein [Pseudomonadota bacterium]